jgi:hypothetical protein
LTWGTPTGHGWASWRIGLHPSWPMGGSSLPRSPSLHRSSRWTPTASVPPSTVHLCAANPAEIECNPPIHCSTSLLGPQLKSRSSIAVHGGLFRAQPITPHSDSEIRERRFLDTSSDRERPSHIERRACKGPPPDALDDEYPCRLGRQTIGQSNRPKRRCERGHKRGSAKSSPTATSPRPIPELFKIGCTADDLVDGCVDIDIGCRHGLRVRTRSAPLPDRRDRSSHQPA